MLSWSGPMETFVPPLFGHPVLGARKKKRFVMLLEKKRRESFLFLFLIESLFIKTESCSMVPSFVVKTCDHSVGGPRCRHVIQLLPSGVGDLVPRHHWNVVHGVVLFQ